MFKKTVSRQLCFALNKRKYSTVSNPDLYTLIKQELNQFDAKNEARLNQLEADQLKFQNNILETLHKNSAQMHTLLQQNSAQMNTFLQQTAQAQAKFQDNAIKIQEKIANSAADSSASSLRAKYFLQVVVAVFTTATVIIAVIAKMRDFFGPFINEQVAAYLKVTEVKIHANDKKE